MSLLEPGSLRATLQLIIAVALIGGAMTLVGTYIYVQGFEDPVVIEIVNEAWTILTLGVGAALAIFGLGRTVSKA